MGSPQVSMGPALSLKFAKTELDVRFVARFEWRSFINEGYVVRAKIIDPYWNTIKDIIEEYLEKSRNEAMEVEWQIEWAGTGNKTPKKKAIITDLHIVGIQAGTGKGGGIEFTAVDPPTYFLNAGNGDGSVFTGTVSDVVKQVINRYAPGIGIQISKTSDYNKNKWWMMRQDPLTFIHSLLEWSSSLTKKKTNWIIASDNDDIVIKEQAELKSVDLGLYDVNVRSPGGSHVKEFEFLADNFLTSFQTKMITQGISAISERVLSKKTDPEEQLVFVKDGNTAAKRNTEIKQDRGTKKPPDTLNTESGQSPAGATSIMAIPEFNGGEIGKRYDEFIDGRARTKFLDQLRLISRLRLRVHGDFELSKSQNLGVSKVTINWKGEDGNFFLSGPWLVYGWHHVVTNDDPTTDWYTDVYLSRYDFDAAAEPV